MNLNDISTQLLYTTVPIWGERADKSQVSGTGFIFSLDVEDKPQTTIPLLITNYHVLEGVEKGLMEFSLESNGKPLKGEGIKVEFDKSVIDNSRLGNLDLVAIPIGSAVNQLRSKGTPVFFKSITTDIIPTKEQIESLSAIEEITFIGYPSGLYDSFNVSSIIRNGITATPIWNNFKGEQEFLIDAGVFPGSSGSPVFILNQGSYVSGNTVNIGSRIYFVGILTESMVRQDSVFLGIGKVINSTIFLEQLKNYSKTIVIK